MVLHYNHRLHAAAEAKQSGSVLSPRTDITAMAADTGERLRAPGLITEVILVIHPYSSQH